MVNNKDLIRAVFDDDNIMKYNKWFFRADWKKAEIENLDTKNSWLRVKYIIWNNGIWDSGIWGNGIWVYGAWEDGIWEDGIWASGLWKNGLWKDGAWQDGWWYKGSWENGTWKYGKIFDSKTNRYIESTVPPNKCKWSLSYGK